MEIRNCKECGRLFNYLSGRPICPECKEKLEEKFTQVKEYIRENVNAGINQVAEENEVSLKQIKQWIREERLCFAEDSPITIECENCGAPIRSGRYCVSCMNSMHNNLASAMERPKQAEQRRQIKDGERMRFLDQN